MVAITGFGNIPQMIATFEAWDVKYRLFSQRLIKGREVEQTGLFVADSITESIIMEEPRR